MLWGSQHLSDIFSVETPRFRKAKYVTRKNTKARCTSNESFDSAPQLVKICHRSLQAQGRDSKSHDRNRTNVFVNLVVAVTMQETIT